VDRRPFLLTSVAGALAVPLAVEAQQGKKLADCYSLVASKIIRRDRRIV